MDNPSDIKKGKRHGCNEFVNRIARPCTCISHHCAAHLKTHDGAQPTLACTLLFVNHTSRRLEKGMSKHGSASATASPWGVSEPSLPCTQNALLAPLLQWALSLPALTPALCLQRPGLHSKPAALPAGICWTEGGIKAACLTCCHRAVCPQGPDLLVDLDIVEGKGGEIKPDAQGGTQVACLAICFLVCVFIHQLSAMLSIMRKLI